MTPPRPPPENTGRKQEAALMEGTKAMHLARGSNKHALLGIHRSIAMQTKTRHTLSVPGAIRQFQFHG
jgi:hypothetical protein